jgi:hypothetical protein
MQRKSKTTLALFVGAVLTTVVAVLLGGGQTTAVAGPPEETVLNWNLNALDALFNPTTAATRPGAGQTPPVAALHIAMVQAAVYDAVNMIEKSHEPYLDGLPWTPKWASKPAAAATAAHHVLVGLGTTPPVPALPAATQTWLNDAYIAELAAIPDGKAKDAGTKAGEAAAAAMLTERTGDGRYVPFSFTCSEAAGKWRPANSLTCLTPPTPGTSDPFAWVARVDPFTLTSESQFRTDGPDPLDSRRYAKQYDEVKRLGGNGTTTPHERTPEQQAVAQFFSVNPITMYSVMLRGLAQEKDLSSAEQARLFAMVNVSYGDAAINCWDDKWFWSNWRPITAIRLGDADGNSKTAGDGTWTPFAGTPPYPDVSSGYNCVTGSVMNAAKAFFGRDRMDFDLTATFSLGLPAGTTMTATRSYKRFTDVIDDTIDARIWQGIHFRTADELGAEIGTNVARWVDDRYFEPVRKKHGHCGDGHDDD